MSNSKLSVLAATFLLVACAAAVPVSTPPARPPSEGGSTSVDEQKPSTDHGQPSPAKAELAAAIETGARVEAVLRDAKCLSMKGTVQSGEERVRYETVMMPTRLRLNVYQEDTLIMAFAFRDGRAQEYRPQKEKRPLLEYDSTVTWGVDDTVFKTDLDCHVGGLHLGWVGPDSDRGPYYREIIESSDQLPDEKIDGQDCLVFRQSWTVKEYPTGKPFENSHTLYVDKDEFVLRRWDTVNMGIHRVRAYQDIVLDKCPEGDDLWRINVGALSAKEQ